MGHVRLSWEPVSGAAGYLVERTGPDGERQLVQHGGSDVPAVPGTAFADTGVDDGAVYRYRVAAVPGAELPGLALEHGVAARTLTGDAGPRRRDVDAARWSATLRPRLADGRLRAADPAALRRRRQRQPHRRGVRRGAAASRTTTSASPHVRAHAILHDDNGVVTRADDGSLAFDFTVVDELYDQILDIGIRPVVELSLHAGRDRPRPRARRSSTTAASSRRRATGRSGTRSSRALAAHLVERYGIDEVAALGLRGVERAQPRGLLDRHAGRLPAPLRRGRARGQGRRRAPARRRPVDRGGGVGRGARGARREARRPARLRHHATPTATCRSTSAGRSSGTASPASPILVDRVGRRLDALRPDPRRRHRRAVRAERHARACRAGWRRWPTG